MAPPRWEVDPYFDLDYHLRWTRASGTADIDQVMRVAEPIAMQGQPPVIWDRAEGFQVFDRWGNQWIDWSSGVLVRT